MAQTITPLQNFINTHTQANSPLSTFSTEALIEIFKHINNPKNVNIVFAESCEELSDEELLFHYYIKEPTQETKDEKINSTLAFLREERCSIYPFEKSENGTMVRHWLVMQPWVQ